MQYVLIMLVLVLFGGFNHGLAEIGIIVAFFLGIGFVESANNKKYHESKKNSESFSQQS